MNTAEYLRPFEQSDFRGYIRWSSKLTRDLGGKLYHACHQQELDEILDDGELNQRSEWALKLPKHGQWSAPGVWTGLNYFNSGNFYGPFLISFPLKVLNGRHFMVFLRKDDNRKRYFFVQYEARIPIYSFGRDLWRKIDPYSYFQKYKDSVNLKPGGIYDIVLTESVSLANSKIEAVDHPRCISRKCSGSSLFRNRKRLEKTASDEFFYWLKQNEGFEEIMYRFPIIDGMTVELEQSPS